MPKNRPREKTETETVEQMLSELHGSGVNDTVSELMEVYESIERSYRAAIMAGEAIPHIASSTNY